MNKKIATFLIIILSILISSPVFAEADEPRWYQVELILFSNNLPEESITEIWPEFPGASTIVNKIELVLPELDNIEAQEDTTNIVRLADTNTQTSSSDEQASAEALILPFSLVEKDQYRLTVSAKKLEKSSKYNLLLHISWRQPAFRAKNDSAVYLYDGFDEINRNNAQLQRDEESDSINPQPDLQNVDNPDAETSPILSFGEDTNPFGPEPKRFFGTFKLTLSRFLHIDIDMIYRTLIKKHIETLATETETIDFESVDTDPELQAQFSQDIYTDESATYDVQDFRLKTSRRVKPDEIHYFDHPLFGIITMVTRYELPKPEEEESLMQPFIP